MAPNMLLSFFIRPKTFLISTEVAAIHTNLGGKAIEQLLVTANLILNLEKNFQLFRKNEVEVRL